MVSICGFFRGILYNFNTKCVNVYVFDVNYFSRIKYYKVGEVIEDTKEEIVFKLQRTFYQDKLL